MKRDTRRMLVRKLLTNFFKHGKTVSTEKRIKELRSHVEIIVNKAKKNTEADKNYMLRKLADRKIIDFVVDQIVPVFKERVGGYVRVIKLPYRQADGAKSARLEWTMPIAKEVQKKTTKVKSVKEQPKK